MRVEIIEDTNAACDEFVRHRPEGKLCHLTQWSQMVARTFGHRAFYLVASDGDHISGVLPLTLVKSRLFGTRLVSQAFSNYGGALAVDPQTSQELIGRAVDLATEHHCQQLELRNTSLVADGLTTHTDKVCMYLRLHSDPEEVWSQLRSEIRNRVRKAKKSQLQALFGGVELLDEFYEVWTARMRELGTPGYPRRLFRSILETFPGLSTVGLVRFENGTVGAGFFYCFNGLAQCRWAAVDVDCNHLAPNVLLYWSAIEHYCREGASVFDFGRSTVGSTQYEFKRRWGTDVVQLHYQYWAPPHMSLSLVRPDDPRYQSRVAMWKKMPLWVTRRVGPYISRSLA